MLKKIVNPRIEIINGKAEADGSSIDYFIHVNYEMEAEACINEFMQILSHCEVMAKTYDSNTLDFFKERAIKKNKEEKEQLFQLASLMESATNQQQLDDTYKKIMTKLDNYTIRLDGKSRLSFEEYIEREKLNAERSYRGNNYDGFYFNSGQYIRNVESEFLIVGGLSVRRKNIMKDYIETAYAHLSQKFTVKKSAETMLERYDKGLAQERKIENLFDEEQPHSLSDKTGSEHVKGSNNEELSGVEEELDKVRGYYKTIEDSISKKRSVLENCRVRLEKIEGYISDGKRQVTDDDIESWQWNFPSVTDNDRKDKQGNPIKFIDIYIAKLDVESKIRDLEEELERLEGVLEGHQEKIVSLTSERDSLIKDDEDSTIEETGIFGMNKLRRAINRLMGVGEDTIDNKRRKK